MTSPDVSPTDVRNSKRLEPLIKREKWASSTALNVEATKAPPVSTLPSGVTVIPWGLIKKTDPVAVKDPAKVEDVAASTTLRVAAPASGCKNSTLDPIPMSKESH